MLFGWIYLQPLSGSKDPPDVYFKFAESVVEEITGATAYRHRKHLVLKAHQTDLISTHIPNRVSIASFHNLIVSRMKTSLDRVKREAPVPSPQLLRISLTRQMKQSLNCLWIGQNQPVYGRKTYYVDSILL
jgi:hypothetical protein